MNVDHSLRLLYCDILAGYSTTIYNKQKIFIAHLTQLDSSLIDNKKEEYIQYFHSLGAPKYQDKLSKIIQDKSWSQEKDKEIEEVKSFILNLQHSKSKTTLNKEKIIFDKEIESYNERLIKLIIEKNKLIGKTAEGRADRKINEFYIYISLFKDRNFKERLFLEEEFDSLHEGELNKLTNIYNEKMGNFTDLNFKKIALMPYFFNIFILAGDNLMNLFGKPLVNLTFYQIEIIQNARNYKNILQNSKTPPPPEYLADPIKLLEWIDKDSTLTKVMENTNIEESRDEKVISAGKSMVGMTKDEMKEIGIDTSANDRIKAALKNKGELSMQDMMKLENI